MVAPLDDAEIYTAFAPPRPRRRHRPRHGCAGRRSGDAGRRSYQFLYRPRTAADRAAVDAAFSGVFLAWAPIVPLQIEPAPGPMPVVRRFYFWPDPRGIMLLRQIQPLIAARAIRPRPIRRPLRASVRPYRRLGALEYLLYGTGAGTLGQAGEDGAFRCAYLCAPSPEISLSPVADSLVTDTGPQGSFRGPRGRAGPEQSALPESQ